MEIPNELRNLVESELEKINIKDLQASSENISFKYRNESGKGKRLVTKDIEAVSYAGVRMPATYGAVYTALKNTISLYNSTLKTVLDVGAGTGAGSWAVSSLIDIEKITCLEREEAMANLGKKLMQNSENSILKNAEWKKFDLLENEIEEKADLVLCSYVLNELSEKDRKLAVQKLWNSANKLLIIIEPGTPIGFNEIKQIREQLINENGFVIAPCPNNNKCQMAEDDWCHATCRVPRTKIHKILKNGDVPYEDEKFSYIAVSKENTTAQNIERVLRHPYIESGKITLKLCNNNGIIEKIVTKKDKELFKIARKLNCGDKV